MAAAILGARGAGMAAYIAMLLAVAPAGGLWLMQKFC